jgi:hypothetical protein
MVSWVLFASRNKQQLFPCMTQPRQGIVQSAHCGDLATGWTNEVQFPAGFYFSLEGSDRI